MEIEWTQPDIVEQGINLAEAGLLCISIYLTVVSGYLVVAYLAGKELGQFQLVTISALFLFFSLVLSLATYALLQSAVVLAGFVENESSSETVRQLLRLVPSIISAVQIIGVVMALKFMWDTRRA